jgi:hypothetical protein
LNSLNSGTAESSRTASNIFSVASPSGTATTTGKRGNAVLKMTLKALHNVSLDPWPIGSKIDAATLVLRHFARARTT